MKGLTSLWAALSVFVALTAGCAGPSAPLVGITCSRTRSGADCLSPNYSRAILRAGAVPVLLPGVRTEEEAVALLSKVDAVVFSGGVDVNPAWYGEAVWNETVEIDSVRDRSDSLLGVTALALSKPVLAICRGEQLLNVLLGGSLYQDIPTQVEGALVHRDSLHAIAVEKGSVLERLFGKDTLMVNSFHHQAVKDPAPGITVTARSADGIVEAYETAQAWAFQFHPEAMLRSDDSWLSLFEAFVGRINK